MSEEVKTYSSHGLLSTTGGREHRTQSVFAWVCRQPLAHSRTLLALAVVVASIRLAGSWLGYWRAFLASEVLALSAVGIGTVAWLVGAEGLMLVGHFRAKSESIIHCAVSALVALPKIFLSCIGMLVLTEVTMRFAAPLLLFIVFFLWAPIFSLLDLVAPSQAPIDDDELDEEDIPQRLFLRPGSIFDFGFLRSFYFSLQHVPLTFQVALLLTFAKLVPLAFFGILLPGSLGFVFPAVNAIVSSIVDVYVVAVTVTILFLFLPKRVQAELKFTERLPALNEIRPNARSVSALAGPKFVLGLSVGIAASLWSLQIYQHREQRIPSQVTASALGAVAENDVLVVRINLEDAVDEFRWLQPSLFRVALVPETGSNSVETGGAGNNTASKVRKITPERVIPFSRGEKIDDRSIAPSFVPVELRLVVARTSEMPLRGVVQVFYPSESGERLVTKVPYALDGAVQMEQVQ